jgi:RNA polymerase sigma-70 factor (ECF subfamily)
MSAAPREDGALKGGGAPRGGDLPEGEDDRMIVGRILAGEGELFRFLVNRHQKPVYAMGLSFFRNPEDAADFVQDVFLKAFRNLSSFEGRSRFSTWLYKIAYNTAVNGISRRKEYRTLVEEDQIQDAETPERRALRSVIRKAVNGAVQELPERYRVCVDLFFFYDRSYREIELITGYPVNTIKSHVFRAKKLLQEELEDYMEGGVE